MSLFDDRHDDAGRWFNDDRSRFLDDELLLGNFRDVVQGASRFESSLPQDHLPIPRGTARAEEGEPRGEEDEPMPDNNTGPQKEGNKRRQIRADNPAYIRALRSRKPRYALSQQRIKWLQDTFGKFARPKTSPEQFRTENPEKALFYFHDVDYTSSDRSKFGPPLLRIAALTEKGNSACIVVKNFEPYLYVKPNRFLANKLARDGVDRTLKYFCQWLEGRVRLKVDDGRQKLPDRMIAEVALLKKFTLYGYQKEKTDVIRVKVASPKLVVPTRDVLWALRRKKDAFEFDAGEGGDAADDHDSMELDDDGNAEEVYWEDEQAKQVAEQVEFEKSMEADQLRSDPYEIFEADVLYALRFMIDKELKGSSWFSVPTSKLLGPPDPRQRQSRCQLEFWVDASDITQENAKQTVPPEIRVLCYDYEMAGREGKFPDPQHDPIICGSFMLFRIEDGDKPLFAASLYVGDSAPSKYSELPAGVPLIDCQFGKGNPMAGGKWNEAAEAEMLLSIQWLETEIFDADLLEGYNSRNYDKCYEFHRADQLGVGVIVRDTSRLRNEICSVQVKTFSSKAHGTSQDASIRMWGRVDWDILPIIRRDKKLRDYTLNAIGTEFLGETKYGLHYSLITPYWVGAESTPETRRIVRDYNHQDVWLTHRIPTKLCYFYRNQGMARVTTLPIELIITRGQAIKTTVLLLRQCRASDIVVPTFATRSEKLSRAGYGIEPGKYNPSMLGKRYRAEKEWDDDSDSDEEEEDDAAAMLEKNNANGATQSTLAPNAAQQNPLLQVQYRPGVDKMIFVQINSGQGIDDVATSRNYKGWTSVDRNNRFLSQAYNERRPDARIFLLFAEHGANRDASKKFYGVAEMTGDFRPGWRLPWKSSQFQNNDCFPVNWLVAFNRQDPPDLPVYLHRHRDCDVLNDREIEELFVKGNIKLKRSGKKRVKENDKYEGAVVIHPICGLYLVPVWTLDFSSLYPSAIICYNMCWTTLISKEEALTKWKPEDYHVTPFGSYFVRKHVREGLLPRMLDQVIASRNESKALLKKAKAEGNLIMAEVHESDQNAKKVVANGSYGYTGAATAPIPLLAIAASTTAYGRDAINLVWEKIETEFELPPELCPNGERPIIIGGDTDSVFGIWPNVTDPKLAMELAIKAADWVSKKYFRDPMKTIFEKLMFPIVMEGRKRYGYVYWGIEAIKEGHPDMVQIPGTRPEEKKKWPRIEAKGIETVRRDNCFFVSDGIASKIRKVLAERDPVGAFVELQREVDDLYNQQVDPAMLVVSKALSKDPEDYDPQPIHAKLAIRMRGRPDTVAPVCGARVPYVVVQGSTKDKTSDLGEDPRWALKNNIPLNIDHYAEAYRKPCKRLFDAIMDGIVERIFDDKELVAKEKQSQHVTLSAIFGKRKTTDDERAAIQAELAKKQRTATPASAEKKKASTRTCSGREGSDKTLAWARKISQVAIANVEERLRADRLERLGTTRRRKTTYASKSSPLASITRVLPKCLACQVPLHCLVCPEGRCDCEGMAKAVCDSCIKERPEVVRDTEKRAYANHNRWKDAHDSLWKDCVKCAGTIEAALECSNSNCRKYFVRDQAKIEYERADATIRRFSLVSIMDT